MGLCKSKSVPLELPHVNVGNNSSKLETGYLVSETGSLVSECLKCKSREAKIKQLYEHNKILVDFATKCKSESRLSERKAKKAQDMLWRMKICEDSKSPSVQLNRRIGLQKSQNNLSKMKDSPLRILQTKRLHELLHSGSPGTTTNNSPEIDFPRRLLFTPSLDHTPNSLKARHNSETGPLVSELLSPDPTFKFKDEKTKPIEEDTKSTEEDTKSEEEDTKSAEEEDGNSD